MNDQVNQQDPTSDYDLEPPADLAEEKAVEIAEATMLGDLMGVVLDEIKAAPNTWPQMSEYAQDSMIGRVERRCRQAVRQAADIIFASGRSTVKARVDYVKFKDGEATCVLKGTSTGYHAIAEAVGQVMIIVPDPIESMDAPHGHEAEKPQGSLDLPENSTADTDEEDGTTDQTGVELGEGSAQEAEQEENAAT